MKKKTKKVPNLPKYNWGGWNSENMNQVNWKAMGQASAQGTAQIASTYNNPDATEYDKYNTMSSSMTNIVGSINPIFGAAVGLGNSIGKPIQASSEQINPDTGKISDPKRAKRNAIVGSLFNPIEAFSYRQASGNWGDIKGDDYVKWVEANKGQQFAMGGMNMVPNAEVEGGENSMTLDGQYTEYDGPSHENGGIPTSLEPQERVFSDRLKMPGTKKTFAKLNEENNTNKEDKILESTKYSSLSKKTAGLMKSVKSKKSEMLFQEQEALKQAKVLNYAKKLGVDPTEFAFGGTYPGMDNPYKNFKGSVPAYGNGGENDPLVEFIRQRYKSDTVPGKVKKYNPEDKDLTFVDKLGRVPLEGSRFQTDSVVNIPGADPNLKAAYKNGKFVIVGTNPKAQQMAAEINKGKFVQGSDKTVYPDYSGYLPKNKWGGSNMLPKYFNGGFDKNDPNQTSYFNEEGLSQDQMDKMNGITYNYNNPSNSSWITQKMLDDNTEAYYSKPNTNIQKTIPVNTVDYSKYNQDAYDKDLQEALNRSSKQPSNKKLNWSEIGNQAAMFAANNAGNIYNLSRYNKPEIEKYDRIMANLLNPKAAINDVNVEGRLAEKNIKDASGGNMGSYLSNRTGLASKLAQGKEKVRLNYDNANAGILTDAQKFNAQIAMQEIIANAQNRARVRSGKGEAIGSMGYNVANQFMDNKKGNMDQKTLQLMMKYYEKYPAFAKMIEEQGWA